MDCEEIVVPAPWGEIAVRIWGNRRHPPILMFHGIMDNAGAYNGLIPLLPSNYHYICVDLPGHGKSTPFPSKSTIKTLDYLLAYCVITKYFQKPKYTMIGHSYGGQLAYCYAQLYPEQVERLVILDVLYFLPHKVENIKNKLRSFHETYFKTMERNDAVSEYEYEEALEKIAAGRKVGRLSRQAAEGILDRIVIRKDNGKVGLVKDGRVGNFLNPLFTEESSLQFIKAYPVECPVLFLLSKKTEGVHRRSCQRILQLFEAKKNMAVIFVEGNHDVCIVYPEKVDPFINTFLMNKANL